MLRRQDEINNILDLYDYIDVLEMENEKLQNAVPKIRSAEKSVSFIDKLMIEKGKEEIFKNVFRNWNKVKCNYNEDTEKYEFTPFNKWVESKVDREYLPKTMSYEDFVTYFKHELSEMYKKEKEESLKEAKENK